MNFCSPGFTVGEGLFCTMTICSRYRTSQRGNWGVVEGDGRGRREGQLSSFFGFSCYLDDSAGIDCTSIIYIWTETFLCFWPNEPSGLPNSFCLSTHILKSCDAIKQLLSVWFVDGQLWYTVHPNSRGDGWSSDVHSGRTHRCPFL